MSCKIHTFLIRFRHNDGDAAETCTIETTTEPREYKHRDDSKICFVKLPAIHTWDLQTFREEFALENYEMFFFITSTSFTEKELKLAKQMKLKGKIFLIRTMIDIDMINQDLDDSQILDDIRKPLYTSADDLTSSENEIFLVSNYHTNKWDFDRLITAISEELLVLQREFLTSATRKFLKIREVYHG